MAAIPVKPVEKSGTQIAAGQHIRPIAGKRRIKPNLRNASRPSLHKSCQSGVGHVKNQSQFERQPIPTSKEGQLNCLRVVEWVALI